MKSFVTIVILLVSSAGMAKPVCTIKTNKNITFELYGSQQDMLSSAETEFNHELVEGTPDVPSREFKVQLSHHIDHYKSKIKMMTTTGDVYAYEIYMARNFINGGKVIFNHTLSLAKEYIERRGTEQVGFTDKPVTMPGMIARSVSTYPMVTYLEEGIKVSLYTHAKDRVVGDISFLDVSMSDIELRIKCEGEL